MSTIEGPVIDEELTEAPQDSMEVHRDGPLSLLVGGSAGVLAVCFLLRGVGSGSLLDWGLCVLTAVVAVMHLAAVVDARAPLFVLDRLGVRVRRGAVWQGVEWVEVDHIEHRTRATTLRDGSLTVVTMEGRRLGVRLSLSTRLVGADWHEVDEALHELTGGRVPVIGRDQLERPAEGHEPVAEAVEPIEAEALEVTESDDEIEHDVDVPIAPLRESRPALRTEVVLSPATIDPDGEESELPIAAETETIFIDEIRDDLDDRTGATDGGDLEPAPLVIEPVVGSQLAMARERVGISVEALADRTRIRPHVIEAIEVDDFESCGGDFYARGHLRTLARVLGVDATELLALYDENYSHAPIDARRVFEAELAATPSGGSRPRSRLNWSVLVAAVMAVVLVWSVARLVMDGPVPLSDQPVLNGSPGGKATLSGAKTKVPVSITAATGGARVIVRDARQQVVFDAQLAFMQTAELSAAPPVRISSTDGGLLVTVDGVDEGSIGATGQDAQRTYVP